MSSTSSVLVQKLAPPKLELSSPCHGEKIGQNSSTGWDFVQSLTKDSRNLIQSTDDSEQVYVHPQVKNSASSLSLKSLEMCTESLGSETGSNIDSDIDEFTSISFEKRSYDDKSPPRTEELSKKVKHDTSFPPPLNSMSGSDFVLKTHREEGRIVIEAISISSCSPYFRAERLNGRLRLSLLINGRSWQSEDERDEINEEENVDEPEKDFEENDNEDGFKGCFRGEILEENGGKIECEMGAGERSCCRCHGDRNGSKRLHSLPLYMAIS